MAECVITAVGVVTPAGSGMPALTAALSSPTEPPRLPLDKTGSPYAPLPSDLSAATAVDVLDRCMAEIIGGGLTSIEALRDERTAIVLGATAGLHARWRPQPPRPLAEAAPLVDFTECAVAAELSARWLLRGPVLTVTTACTASAAAVALGADLISSGFCNRALVGGAEVLSWFDVHGFRSAHLLSKSGVRPFDRARDGLMLGEGGGLVLLERSGPALARLRGWASNNEQHDISQPEPSGERLRNCVAAALAAGDCRPGEVDYVNAHGTGTVANDASEARALSQIWSPADETLIGSSKGLHGHLRGACGVVELLVSLAALRAGVAPPTWGCREPDPECRWNLVVGSPRYRRMRTALSLSRGFGGSNVALLIDAETA